MYQIQSLGQVDESVANSPLVVTNTQTADTYGVIGTVWKEIYDYCLTKLPEQNCRGLLGYQPVYFPPELKKCKWYVYLAVGYALARFL